VPSDTRRPGYTIAAVSKLTGVGCHTLRAWERRHGFPRPGRSAFGHRRYSDDEVRLLCHVAGMVRQGRPIGAVLTALGADDTTESGQGPRDDAPVDAIAATTTDLVDRLTRGDVPGAEALVGALALGRDASSSLAAPRAMATGLLGPGLIDVGERWFRGECGLHQERCATNFLIRKLHVQLDAAQRANAHPRGLLLLGATRGELHEGGLLVLATLLEQAGFRALMIGVDLPASELPAAVERWSPDALALSFVLSRGLNRRFGELRDLVPVPIYVGGRGILNHQRLARQNGLIPLVGPASETIGPLLDHLETRRGATRRDASLSFSASQP
jgi:DNA-binding transcriptional MerR regulator